MRSLRYAATVGLVCLSAVLSSCGGTVSDEYEVENDPGSVEHIEGTELGRVTVTDAAAQRLRLETDVVRREPKGLVVPSSAIFADTHGTCWVYISRQPLTFVREEVKLVHNQGGLAVLASGPPPGTDVVTQGAPELYGIEFEVGH